MSAFKTDLYALSVKSGQRVYFIYNNKLVEGVYISGGLDNNVCLVKYGLEDYQLKNIDEVFLWESDAYRSILKVSNKEISQCLNKLFDEPFKKPVKPLTKKQKLFRWWNKLIDKLRINGY